MKKYCTRCGHEFEAVGREVICPSCKAQVAEETKRATALKAKRASWTGESVPVRISGRASTVIRRYAAAHGLPFSAALDALLKSSDFFKKNIGGHWEDVEPYKSRRRDKASTTETAQDKASTTETAQDTASKPQDAPQEVKTARVANKTSTANTTAKKAASKTTSKAAGKAARK